MNYSPILIVAGEPNSIFLEIFFKVLKNNRNFESSNSYNIKQIIKYANEKIKI
jgi:hypothetical protein